MWASFAPGRTSYSLTDAIALRVLAQEHPQLGTLSTSHPLEIRFSSTTGRVVDKLMGRLQERNLDRTAILAPSEY